jgi:hypothetical protein
MKKVMLTCSLIVALIFASCPGPDGGADGGGTGRGTGTITINLGLRAAVDAWPSSSNAGLLPYLEHKVTLTNGSITHTYTIDRGKTSATITAAAGTWNVTLEAYYDSYKFGTGAKSVDVKEGMSNPCSITMKKADESAEYFLVSTENDWKEACDEIGSYSNPGGNYVIFVTDNIKVNYTLFIPTGSINVTICGNKEIRLNSPGGLLYFGSNQTVTLQDVKLVGIDNNTTSLVYFSNGEFMMKGGASVSGNTVITANQSGGGVHANGGTFTMKDNASVSSNGSIDSGGGVYLVGGTFTMQDNASVSGNSAGKNGGGVCVDINGTFFMKGSSSVSSNDSFDSGGGVAVTGGGTFIMEGGTIYGSNAGKLENKAQNGGAAIYVSTTPPSTAKYGGAYGNGSIISENGTIPPK